MGDIVNFNKARKAKARGAAKAVAEANRAKFGRTKAEKTRDATENARAAKQLDGAKIDRD